MSNQTQPGFPALIPQTRNICFDPPTRDFSAFPRIELMFLFTNTGIFFQFFSLFPVFVDFITYDIFCMKLLVQKVKLARLLNDDYKC